MILKIDAKFEEKPICCFKNDKNLVNFDPSTQVSKICTVICPFCAKYITFDQKKYRGVIFNDTEESCKIWRKTGLWFGKWHEEFGKFSPEHSKISKICTLMGCFWSKYIIIELRNTQELCLMALKIDTKFEEKLTCASKNDMRNLANIHQSTFESSNLGTFIGSFYPK